MVSKNWDKKEQEIEQEQHELHSILKRDQKNMLDTTGYENFSSYDVERSSILRKQYTDETEQARLVAYVQFLLEREESQAEEISKMQKEISELQKSHRRMHLDDLLEQNEISRKALESILGNESDDVDTTSLDGLLKDYVDPEQNSQELVRSVRDN